MDKMWKNKLKDKNINIAFLANNMVGNGGCEIATERIVYDLKEKGQNVEMYNLGRSADERYISFGSKKNILNSLSKSSIINIVRRLKRDDINVLVVQIDGPLSPVFDYKLIREVSKICRVVCVLHTATESYRKWYGFCGIIDVRSVVRCMKTFAVTIPYTKYRFQQNNKFVDQYLVLSKSSGDKLKRCFGAQSIVIMNPLPPVIYVDDIDDLLVEKNIVVFLGRLDNYQKNLVRLLSSWQYINHPDWELLLVGDGPDKKSIVKYIQKKRIHNVKLTGRKDIKDARKILFESKILALPSNFEGFPNVFTEAMQARTAIVTTKYDGFSDNEMIDGYNCIVTSTNSRSFADGINSLIEDEAKRKKIVRNAYQYYMDMAKVSVVDKWINVLNDSLVENGKC